MRKIRIRRDPVLYLTALAELLILHFVLCYPGAVARGWPPLEPFWLVSIYIAFLGIGLLPAFDDFSYAPKTRWISLTAFSVASSIILGVVGANHASGRPSIGHLTGYLGVFYYEWFQVLLYAFTALFLAFPFVLCWESVCRGIWGRLREFSSPVPKPMGLRGLIRIVVSVGILCGILRFLISLKSWHFNRPFF